MTPRIQRFGRLFALGMVAGLSTLFADAQSPAVPHLTAGSTMSKEQIIAEGDKMADAQLAQFASKRPGIGWVPAVMWAGLADFSHVSSQSTCTDAIAQIGDFVHWKPGLNPKRPSHADDLAICQTFLDAYVTQNDPARLAPTQSREDAVCAAIQNEVIPANVADPKNPQLIWWWCDALFMAPPTMARLSVVTHDPKYVNAMDTEWWRTADLLYDKDEHLFFRDNGFLGQRTKNGRKIFWSRGNGWVFAGLARTLTYLPANYPSRPKYVVVFKDMAAKLASLQQADGTWPSNLLDPAGSPGPETSGTALDCFAYAWGINNGLLDRTTYLPIATKAWAALLAAKRPDGLLGYVQRVGRAPGAVTANETQLYATGAFLMAVCELSKLAPIAVSSVSNPSRSTTGLHP